jgi:MoaA/NifB/PqqE/SkfB family radical SAM enzyme
MKDWDIAEEDRKDLLKFLEDLGMGKVNRGKKISEARQVKYLDLLKPALEQIKKPISKITLKDTEALEKWVFKTEYAQSSKSALLIAFKIYIKWKLGEVNPCDFSCGSVGDIMKIPLKVLWSRLVELRKKKDYFNPNCANCNLCD